MSILITLFTTITICSIIYGIFTTKKIDILNTLLLIILHVLIIYFKQITWLKIVFVCLLGLNSAFAVTMYVLLYSAYDLRKKVLFNYMKENE